MKILIITGGSSSERKISLISAKSVKEGLDSNGHTAKIFDFKKGYAELKKILHDFDLAFPVMHGKEGEDGKLYKYLYASKIPFVGSKPKGAAIAFDKISFKEYCDKNKMATASWKLIKSKKQIIEFGFPCVLKGAFGGSSHEVALLTSSKDLFKTTTKKLLATKNKFYVERMLDGTEITVGILLNKALPVIEIIPPDKNGFDYKNKYSGETKEIPFAPSIDSALQRKVQQLALKIHKDLNLGSYSRTDFIVQNGVPYLLETNTPGGVGFTPVSSFPKAALAAGYKFKNLLQKIITGGLVRQA